MIDRFGYCLVDGLVETNDIPQSLFVGPTCFHPPSKDAGAQGSVLDCEFVDVETTFRPQDGVRLCRCFRIPAQFRG